jgi:hypothetical protein
VTRLSILGIALAAGLAAGCGGPKVVPVSGRVTLNGKPLPNASVEFLPIVDGVTVVAPGSAGQTDADGAYTLYVVGTGQPGAVVGCHPVTIYVRDGTQPAKSGPLPPREQKQVVPPRYGSGQALSFEVPPEGSAQADFALTSP